MDVTLKQVADLAGVSTTTVSFVLNKRRQARAISAKTRERVHRVARELQYSPNHLAKSLRTRKTLTIGILTGSCLDSHLGKLIEGINVQCTREGFRSILASVSNDEDPKVIARNVLNASVADAIVIVDRGMDFSRDVIEAVASDRRPVVLVGKRLNDPPCPCVCDDYLAYGYEGTRYFLDRGKKTVAYIGFDNDSTDELLRGACQAFEDMRVPWRNAQLIGMPFKEYHCLRFDAREKLSVSWPGKDSVPDALYFLNDQFLYAALSLFKDLGVRVPEDTSIIGYGDMDMIYNMLSSSLSRALTQPGHSGSKALELVVAQLRGEAEVSPDEIITFGGSFRFR